MNGAEGRAARGGWGRRRLLAFGALVIGGTAGSVGIGWAVRASEEGALRQAAETQAEAVATQLEAELQMRILALQRMADRWRLADGTPRASWEQDAHSYVTELGGVRAIEVVDASGQLVWVTPAAYRSVLGDVRDEPERWGAMNEAWLRARSAMTGPLALDGGGVGVLSVCPLYRHDRFDGWLGGVLEIGEMLGWTTGTPASWILRVSEARGALFVDPRPATTFCAAHAVNVLDVRWHVETCAAPELADARRGSLPYLVVAVGMAFTTLAASLFAARVAAAEGERRARDLASDLQEQADALDRAQRELAEVSWSISHELRAPLRAIDGYAAILAERGAEVGPLGRIRANAQRMSHQLDGLLALLRIARAPVRPVPVNISLLARRLLDRHAAEEPERDVVAEVEDGIVVRGDAVLVTTIVEALLDNAWKFTRTRAPGHVTVRACPGGFRVEDDGVGFDPAFERKLFDAFDRLHAPGEFEGLGLGLALAARAAARHRGRIRGEGRPGRGASFSVELPE